MVLLVVYFDYFHKDLMKRLREYNIQFEAVKYDNINLDKTFDKIIITGSKKRILREHNFPLLEKLLHFSDAHVIGICFGFQYLALKTGGELSEGHKFVGLRGGDMYFNHFDRVTKLPEATWTTISRQNDFINIACTERWVGFQFHPEKSRANFERYILPLILFSDETL